MHEEIPQGVCTTHPLISISMKSWGIKKKKNIKVDALVFATIWKLNLYGNDIASLVLKAHQCGINKRPRLYCSHFVLYCTQEINV